jgi:hypothetical protein
VVSRLFRDVGGGTADAAIIAGVARSGTTWLAETVASQVEGRILFEPFNTKRVPRYRSFQYLQYMRPDDDDPALQSFTRAVLSGQVRDPRWIDRLADRMRPRFRVVKAVRACLMLGWIHNRFPDVPLVHLVRHPCAVAASFARLEWPIDADIRSILAQPKLADDMLQGRTQVIRSAEPTHRKVALVWCVNNLVALRQLADVTHGLVFYEHLVRHPHETIPHVFATLGRPFDDSVFAQIQERSATSRDASSVPGAHDPTAAWTSVLRPGEVADVLDIVRDFGLGHLYRDDGLPAEAP